MIKTILFDMDGVLFDTEIFYAQKRYDFFHKYNIECTWSESIAFAGANSHDYIPVIFQRHGYSELQAQRLTDEYHTTFRPREDDFYQTYAFKGLENTIQELYKRGYQLAVVSNSSLDAIDMALTTTKIKEYFDFIIPGNNVKKRKPDPEIYLKAIKKCSSSIEDIVVIEDSTKGIQAAKAASLRVICKKDDRFNYDQSGCWKYIDDLAELLEIL